LLAARRFAIVWSVISVEDAQEIILQNVADAGDEIVPLSGALGRILRQEVVADMDLPPFDRAQMDGYAVKAEDTATVPAKLRVIGEVAAGASFSGTVTAGQAVKIMTGAPVPAGATAVQRVERTQSNGDGVLIQESVRVGENITPRASQVRNGEVVLEPGSRIGPAEMAVLATFGCREVRVSRRPVVGILSTGTELVDVGATPSPSQIRDSNSFSVFSYLELIGAETKPLGIAADDESLIEREVRSALKQFDALIVTGGVSMGDYDLVKTVLRRIGATIFFEKVRIHPGKPTVFATYRDKPVFALPGNPVSVAVTFLMFVYPALNLMTGNSNRFLPVIEAHLVEEAKHSPDRRSYLPGELCFREGKVEAQLVPWSGSSDLVAFTKANALIVVPEGIKSIKKGELCKTVVLPGCTDSNLCF
jgi:molybdenum cofactor synthesis domain-containing protein